MSTQRRLAVSHLTSGGGGEAIAGRSTDIVHPVDRYAELNLASWDERAPAHAASDYYALSEFVEDPQFLSQVVRFDLPRLGDIRGLRGIHLQCHIGTDTISLARLGAEMTGLDFSPAALAEARELSARSGTPVEFVESELYEAPQKLPTGAFDLVYTGVGALCWLPSIARWADVVTTLLRPGGRFFMREFHPMLWTLGEPRSDGLLVIEYPYFERDEPLVFDEPGTYVETPVSFEHNMTHEWNHGLGEIVTALLERGMELTMLLEHDTCPNDILEGGVMEEVGDQEWRLIDRPWRLPHSYTLQAVKR
jgi:SAM-dependent methyltransferase